jgi:hypothetical protein
MNTAVTDEGETVIAADMMRDKGGAAWDTTAHQRIASNATVHKRLANNAATHEWIATNATVNKHVAAGHSAAGKAGTRAKAASAARGTAPEVTTATMTTTAASSMRSYRAGRNRRHTKRSRCHQCYSEPTQHGTFLPIAFAKPLMGFASLNPSYELVKNSGSPLILFPIGGPATAHENARPDGLAGGWGMRSHQVAESWLFPGRFLGRQYVVNSTELHWFLTGNLSCR